MQIVYSHVTWKRLSLFCQHHCSHVLLIFSTWSWDAESFVWLAIRDLLAWSCILRIFCVHVVLVLHMICLLSYGLSFEYTHIRPKDAYTSFRIDIVVYCLVQSFLWILLCWVYPCFFVIFFKCCEQIIFPFVCLCLWSIDQLLIAWM